MTGLTAKPTASGNRPKTNLSVGTATQDTAATLLTANAANENPQLRQMHPNSIVRP
jgi:hypothetical protein